MTHEPMCRPPWSWGEGGHCQGCELITEVRAVERALCVAIATLSAGKSPTLGQQRMLRALRGES